MRLFLYEYVTGGGMFLSGSDPPAGSLLREGQAMVAAVSADFQAVADVQVCLMRDVRLPAVTGANSRHQAIVDSASTHSRCFDQSVASADAVILIAPETSGRLHQLASRAEQHGVLLLSPDSAFVALATDKVATARHLADAGVPVPRTRRCRSPGDVSEFGSELLVSKPIDGAGSWQVNCTDRAALSESLNGQRELCVQEFCSGKAASVAALCGGESRVLLPPCWQFVAPPDFAYQGGELITSTGHVARAERLARQAFDALPNTTGYVGVDLVLGAPDNGCRDFVIEVNSRLTTSYVGLRQSARQNLAWNMWQVAIGQPPHLSFHPGGLQFDSSGHIRPAVSDHADHRSRMGRKLHSR